MGGGGGGCASAKDNATDHVAPHNTDFWKRIQGSVGEDKGIFCQLLCLDLFARSKALVERMGCFEERIQGSFGENIRLFWREYRALLERV